MLKKEAYSYADCYKALWSEKEVSSELMFVRRGTWQLIAWFLVVSFPALCVSGAWGERGEDVFTVGMIQLFYAILIACLIRLLLPLLLQYTTNRGWLKH